MSQILDPFDAATAAGERAGTYYGKVSITAQFVQFPKGGRKTAWAEGDDADARRTEMFISLNPIDAMGLTRPVERNPIAESKEWSGIVWPSLRDLGLHNARELNGKYVRAEMIKTGRTWTNAKGATVEGTTFKFTALYADEKACTAAFEADTGRTAGAHSSQNGNSDGSSPAGSNGNSDMERLTAMQFLPALVAQAAGDRAKLAATIASVPMVSKFFTIDSPEVVALIGGK